MICESHIEEFKHKGFTVVHNAVGRAIVEKLKPRFAPLFSGKFPRGYPDDWSWRPDFGLPTVTRFLINAWKCDPGMAQLVLHPSFSKAAAMFAGWPGARVGNDSLWWKPPGANEIAFHQDASEWIPFLTPNDIVTCWIALDDCLEGVGTIQYVPGSHKWPLVPAGQCDLAKVRGPYYQRFAEATALSAGVQNFTVNSVIGSAGLCVFHHGLVWHGSERNSSPDRSRRSIAIHFLSSQTKYGSGEPKFIFARYKDDDSDALSEKHFPITWREDGYQSIGVPESPTSLA